MDKLNSVAATTKTLHSKHSHVQSSDFRRYEIKILGSVGIVSVKKGPVLKVAIEQPHRHRFRDHVLFYL